MNIQFDAKAHVKSIRHLVIKNKDRWKDMAREHDLHNTVPSATYIRRFANGEFPNPGVLTLENIQNYLS